MSKILEEIGLCWNDVNVDPDGASSIQSGDKVTLYSLIFKETTRGAISDSSWNDNVDDCNNIIILKRDTRHETMCRNANIRDAADDMCDILSEWNDRFLWEYNMGLYEGDQFQTVNKLMRGSTDKFVYNRVERVAEFLGGITFNELAAMGVYKLNRNKTVHKARRLSQRAALERFNVASVQMTPTCKTAVEKCIKMILY